MKVKTWLGGVVKVKQRPRAVTPLPPEPKKEGEAKKMGFQLTLGNDKMADACLIVGLVSLGIIISSVSGFVMGLKNDFFAQQYFNEQHAGRAGRIAFENAKAYSDGLFEASLSLQPKCEVKTLSQAKPNGQ